MCRLSSWKFAICPFLINLQKLYLPYHRLIGECVFGLCKWICSVFCKSKFVVNGNSQTFYFIFALYMFIFYYKYDVDIIYWWSEKYYLKYTWISYHTINLKPVWNNMVAPSTKLQTSVFFNEKHKIIYEIYLNKNWC